MVRAHLTKVVRNIRIRLAQRPDVPTSVARGFPQGATCPPPQPRARYCSSTWHGKERTMNILQGVRVVDVTAWMFVPGCGGVLAHWGADVIKVEPSRFPDPGRGMTDTQSSSISFKHYNRGKRGIALDL